MTPVSATACISTDLNHQSWQWHFWNTRFDSAEDMWTTSNCNKYDPNEQHAWPRPAECWTTCAELADSLRTTIRMCSRKHTRELGCKSDTISTCATHAPTLRLACAAPLPRPTCATLAPTLRAACAASFLKKHRISSKGRPLLKPFHGPLQQPSYICIYNCIQFTNIYIYIACWYIRMYMYMYMYMYTKLHISI